MRRSGHGAAGGAGAAAAGESDPLPRGVRTEQPTPGLGDEGGSGPGRQPQGLAPYKNRVHTITYDNGREFADHEGMAADLETRIYFAHPYASWERGLNENTNGLIRQYFPKHRDLTTVTEREIEQAMDKLNHRPRKSLGFRTPHEVFFNTRTSLTVALQS
jgi:hypothetical protein